MDELYTVFLDPVTEGFLDYLLQVRRLSHRTVTDMRCTYKQVMRTMHRIRPGLELWRLSFDDYVTWLNESRRQGKSPLSIGKDISHLRNLIDYAWRSGRVERNVLDGFKIKDLLPEAKRAPVVLTVEEAKKLIAACPAQTAQQRADRLMILLLYGCGLRTGELCRLDAKDVDIDRQELFIREAKGDIQRRVPVPERVWTELLAYMAQRRAKRGALFITECKRKRIREHDVLLVVHAASKRAGFEDGLMPKTLRHSYGTHLMDAGIDLSLISSLMGHRSPTESGVYLHALPGTRESAVRRISLTESEALDSAITEKEEAE